MGLRAAQGASRCFDGTVSNLRQEPGGSEGRVLSADTKLRARVGVDGLQKAINGPPPLSVPPRQGRGGGAVAGDVRWGERPLARPSTVGVVVKVAALGFRVTGLPMAGGCRGQVECSDGPTVVAVRPTAEARWLGSAASRPGQDPRWAVAGTVEARRRSCPGYLSLLLAWCHLSLSPASTRHQSSSAFASMLKIAG